VKIVEKAMFMYKLDVEGKQSPDEKNNGGEAPAVTAVEKTCR